TRKYTLCLARRTHRDKVNAKMHALLATADAPRQDKRENAHFACRGERTAKRKTRKCTLCLPRRTHRDKINAKIQHLLATTDHDININSEHNTLTNHS